MLSDHFEYLDSLETKQIETIKCCEKEENMMAEDGIVKCKCCGKDVSVNVNYPIEQVTCQVCYVSNKMLKKGSLDI